MTRQKDKFPKGLQRKVDSFIEQHCMHVSVDVEYDIYDLLDEAYEAGISYEEDRWLEADR